MYIWLDNKRGMKEVFRTVMREIARDSFSRNHFIYQQDYVTCLGRCRIRHSKRRSGDMPSIFETLVYCWDASNCRVWPIAEDKYYAISPSVSWHCSTPIDSSMVSWLFDFGAGSVPHSACMTASRWILSCALLLEHQTESFLDLS
jgi:hypothetical protein